MSSLAVFPSIANWVNGFVAQGDGDCTLQNANMPALLEDDVYIDIDELGL